MPANVATESVLDAFRDEWVNGHLDYQRAWEALELTRQVVLELRTRAEEALDDLSLRRAEQAVEAALRRVAEVEVDLIQRFDRFCLLR